uniref:DUF1985 domain-containing protein n=1 Tax=Lactuca sativa TaxID=4236 RepID=A0A9R1XNG3_LACSA|nr:hypothetical protein LSAT_V11C400162540 [Lactuca sativa]
MVLDVIFLDVPRLQGDGLLFHKMFLHQIRSDAVLSPDGIKRLYFRVGDTKMVYGPEEFCLITGLSFGEYPKNIGKKVSEKIVSSKKRCLLRERLFSNYTNSSVKIGDLKSFVLNQPFLEVDDTDAVRVCLKYILCESFLGKEINDRVSRDWFFLVENVDVWNSERKSVSSSIQDHFRRQDESSSSMSSSGRSHDKDVFVEEVNNEDLWNNISFEEPAVFQTNFDVPESEERNANAGCSRNKFDDDVFDVNDYNEAKEVLEEDEVIITGNVNYYDVFGFDGKEVTPDRPRSRNSSKYLCPPYTELHMTPKQQRRPKKKVDINLTSPIPPPTFVIVHDFSVLRLQPYVAGGEQITIWYRLLMERRFDSDRHTIMPPIFFVCHALEEGHDWRAFMVGIATYLNFMVAWWDVDTVN